MENRAETDEVTKKDIPELLNFLNPVASKCYHLGLQLGVDSGELDNIKENYRNMCEREILIKRLKQGSLTWAALLKALESKSVGEKRLAQEIRLHFLTPPSLASAQSDKPSVSSFAHHNTPSSSSPSIDPLSFKHHSSVEQWQSTCIQPESPVTQAISSQSQVNTPPTNRSRPHPQPHPQPTQHSVESEESHNDTPASFSSHQQSTPPQPSTLVDQLKPLGTLSCTHQHSANQQSSYSSKYIHEPLHQSLATAG